MTEQTKIPLPSEGASLPSGSSLIERAAGRFDFASFQAPKLPPEAPPRAKAPTIEAPIVAPVAETILPVAAEVEVAPAAAPVAELAVSPPVLTKPVALAHKPFTGMYYPIDRAHLREQCLIEPEGQVTGLLEEFRIVKRQLLLAAAESRAGHGADHGERILVCSAHPGEGKTFCAVNLALSIAAEKDNEVLLVDADFAKPSVLSTLGLPGGPGLMDALADESVDVEACILGTDIPGLYVLPAGNSTGSDTEFLASSRTQRVLNRLTEAAPSRIVIFDSPPALAASPASELAMHVGQAVLIVRADRTDEAALKDALSILSGCEDIKLLLNCTKFSPTGRRFGSYYGYKE